MHDLAIDDANQAIYLDPNDPESYYVPAWSLVWTGRANEALKYISKAMRFDPYYPPYYLYVVGLAPLTPENMKRLQVHLKDF